jgi:hypothetical protein
MATARVLTPQARHVRIIHPSGEVDIPSVSISKSGGEHLTWFAHKDHGATIRFGSADKSPFHESVFRVPAGESITSGPIRPEAEHKEYKYDVITENGVVDPQVIIRP